jgi:carboxyl-terminal processing protease
MLPFLKKFHLVIILVLLVALGFTLGVAFGQNHPVIATLNSTPRDLTILNDTTASTTGPIDMAPFWKVWGLLDSKYVATGKKEPATTTAQDRVWGAIEGMTDSLGDPYTVFMPPEDATDFKADISGNFEGIGMEIGIKDNMLSVVSPLKGSPAEAAGLKTGDKIITINGESAVKLPVDKAVKLIRGPKDTTVKISVLRGTSTKPIDFEVKRAVINIPSVKTEIKDDIFVLSLYNFYAESRGQFNQGLRDFIKSKKHKLIIDLRGNPGGYLDSAVDMASWFLPLGKIVVRENFGEKSDKAEIVYRSKGYNVFNDKLKIAILVDEGSASASEILAGALQENGKAKLIGTKTYGKGSVQELIQVTKDTALKVTVAKWLTPGGKSISETGITPDYEVKLTEADLKAEKDPQMEKAVEVLKI